jgi:hypothetical protein
MADDIFASTASQLPDQFGSLFQKQRQFGEEEAAKSQKAEEEFAKLKGETEIKAAQAKAASVRGGIGGEQAVYKKYEKELMAPAPTIQYTKDTKEGMMSLAALLPMAAAMMGGKGHASALGALQSMSGVLQGHEEGNQARIALEEKNFKEKLDAFNRHQGQIKEAFERSLQMAKLNASAAQSQLEVKLAELNAPLLAAQVKRDGVVSAATRNLAAFDKMTNVIEQSLMKMTSGSISDESISFLADRYLSGDKSAAQGLGLGASGQANRNKFLQAVSSRAAEKGITGDQLAKIMQEYSAETGAQKSLATTEAKLKVILNTTRAAIPAAIEASTKVPRTKFVPVNKLIQKGQVATSDPDLQSFAMANLQLAEGWARAMNPTGVMRESDRDLALNTLSTATSPETYASAVNQLKLQLDRELQSIQSIEGKTSSAPATPTPDSAGEFEGFTVLKKD